MGSDGAFYGTTYGGGDSGEGTVFQLTAGGTYTRLHSFDGSDGVEPFALAQGSDGNFYGLTSNAAGTTPTGENISGSSFFQITPAGVFHTLHTFSSKDGVPAGNLAHDSDDTFYGMTAGGGLDHRNSAYQIDTSGNVETLYSFDDDNTVNSLSSSGLVLGSDGNLYGTTNGDNYTSYGTIFQLTTAGVLTTLHTFDGGDGSGGFSLLQGRDGNLYGTTSYGGTHGHGTIFELTLAGNLRTLYNFYSGPGSGFIEGDDGNFYGTTNGGGSVYQLAPAGIFTTVYTPAQNGSITSTSGALLQGSDGSFFGPASTGGVNKSDVIFKLMVDSVHPAFFQGETPLANSVYYLAFTNGNSFGYYSYLSDSHYLYHFDLGYEYVFDAADGTDGIYLYDFTSNTFFYTSPVFPFPYLYDFSLNSVLYYYPDPNDPGHYNTDGVRYFYRFDTGQIIVK